MTIPNVNITHGVIPYGSNDDSVVYQDDLKATPSNGSAKGTVSFDKAGMLLGEGGWMFDLSALGHAALDIAGQFSFEVSKNGIGDPLGRITNGIGSDGADTLATVYLASWGATNLTTAAPYGRIFDAATDLIQCELVTADPTRTLRLTNHIVTDYMKITLSWNGGMLTVYIDGALYGTALRSYDTDVMKYFHLATNRGSLSGFWPHVCHMKNFIISSSPVMTPTHPGLAKVALMGDSFANQATQVQGIESAGYQNNATNQAAAYLRRKGVGINFVQHAIGGVTATNTGTADVVDQIAGIIADNPSHVLCQLGTNDTNNSQGTQYDATNFETDYKSHITAILAGTTGKILIGNVVTIKGLDEGATINAIKEANRVSANAIIASFPDWWDAANPSDTGRVVLFDLDAEIGGTNAEDIMLSGLWDVNYDNYLNDAHLSSKGRQVEGLLWGETLFKSLF